MSKYIFTLLISVVTFKLSSQIPSFQWANKLNGTSNEIGKSIAVDASGNVYTTGTFIGTTDFDPGPSTFTLTSFGLEDIFICKLNSTGNFVWAKQLGGSSSDIVYSILLDGSGNIYTTGSFMSVADFDPSTSTSTLTSLGAEDVFLSKLDPLGNFVFAKQIGGSTKDVGRALKIDGSGNIITTGNFSGLCDFDPGVGVSQINSFIGSDDIFVCKLNSVGNFVWAKQMGGTLVDIGRAITLDAVGNIYTTGSTQTGDFDPGPGTFYLNTIGASEDVYVSKLDPLGNFLSAVNFGGSVDDQGISIALDASGNIITTGNFANTVDFDPGPGTYTLMQGSGGGSSFISKLSPTSSFIAAFQYGAGNTSGPALAIDAADNMYLTGGFNGNPGDLDPGPGTFTIGGYNDIYVSKVNSSGNLVWGITVVGMGVTSEAGNAIAIDAAGSVYTTGYFQGTLDFDPNASSYTLTPNALDAYVYKLSPSGTSVNEKSATRIFSIYPNPNSGTFNLQFQNPIENGELILFNSIGQKVFSQKIKQSENEIKTPGLAKGLYHYSILQNKTLLQTGKIVIE